MIQYSYNLYRLNGAQTIISPLSTLVSLDKGIGLGGGAVNDTVGASPIVSLPNLDVQYTHVKVYAIKYTSYNLEPEVSIIIDEEISNYKDYTFFDDGNVLSTISVSEFLFLGSNPFIPKHINSKENRLFAAHITEQPYILEIDFRAYSFNDSGGARIWDDNGGNIIIPAPSFNAPLKHDAINKDYENYKYQSNGATIGGEGKYLKYSLPQTTEYDLNGTLKDLKFFKDNEIYRIGIQLYNKIGQINSVTWIADFVAPEGNLSDKYNTLKVELKPEFYTYIDSLNLSEQDNPIGYKIVRANRELVDKTILTQGPLTGMIIQTTKDHLNFRYWAKEANRQEESLDKLKTPTPTIRDFDGTIYPVADYNHLGIVPSNEIYKNLSWKKNGRWIHWSWQYNKIMQMYSPDVLFNSGLAFGTNLDLSIKGIAAPDGTDAWLKKVDTRDLNETDSRKDVINTSYFEVVGDEWGLIAQDRNMWKDKDEEGGDSMKFISIHKKYSTLTPSDYKTQIYGAPEITTQGQGITTYNGNNQFQYTNTLTNVITCTRNRKRRKGDNDDDLGLTGVNSHGATCITLVQGSSEVKEYQRKSLEEIYYAAGLNGKQGILIGEIKRSDNYIYEGNIYGGRSYEEKTRTTYLEIGEYQTIENSTQDIHSPGDTFVQTFSFARMSKTDTQIFDQRKLQLNEIIDVKVETTINLLNRNDLSLYGWDNKHQPRYKEYHDYNRVYSQAKSLVQRQPELFKFKQVNNFDTRIISSKLKIPGEFIDSWTDFLENEKMDLDGKYGPTNGLVNSNDKIFTLQDTAIAYISINPRVQTQGSDGISIELGTGTVLHSNDYITTSSGSINKWSAILSPTGFYYYDAFNRTFNFISGGKQVDISTTKGMHSFFQNNINFDDVKKDNPLLKTGITGIYDPINDTVLVTVLQASKPFTISYNEKYQSFESFYDFKPSLYISKGFRLLSTDASLTNMYEHFKGNYNTFYGSKYPSDVTLQMRPESNDNMFTNISYKSEVTSSGIDIPKATLTDIRCWNEYQDTTTKPLILNKNLSRKFRMWKANIPREIKNGKPTLDRIRGQWGKLYLKFDNNSNYKIVLHDITISYVAYPN